MNQPIMNKQIIVDKLLNESNGSYKDLAEDAYDAGYQAALQEHAANKEDKWKELEDWVEDNFSKTNDYGTSLTFQGEEIISKIQSLKPLPTPPKTNKL